MSWRAAELSYWKLTSGAEVDFIANDMEVAIEAKATRKVTADDLKAIRTLREDHPRLAAAWVVSLETRSRRTEDGIWILPALDFVKRLEKGELF
jgi:predicted AAA+ superfamily ATPase